MGLIQDQLSTTSAPPLIRRSSTTPATAAIPASPEMMPSVTVEKRSLFATWFILARMGSKMDRALFCIVVQTWAQVIGMDSNFALVSSATENSAFFTTSDVISPCSAYCLMEPSATPM